MKILVADDQPLILKAISTKLQKAGYDIIGAVDGLQAIQLFDEEHPDLVLTDIYMPFATGLEFIRHIREERNSQIPVLVLSRTGIEDTVLESFALGANDYVTKPFIPGELAARIKRLLSR